MTAWTVRCGVFLGLMLAPVRNEAAPPPIERPPLDPKGLEFSDGTVGWKYRRFEAEAGMIAQPGWLVEPLRNRSHKGGAAQYVAEWARTPDRRGKIPLSFLDGTPNHFLRLTGLARSSGDPRIAGCELVACRIPEKGWGAAVSYQTYDGAAPLGEHFRIFLFHGDHNLTQWGGQGKWALDLVDGHFSAYRKQSHFQYYLQVSRYDRPQTWYGDTRTPRDEEVAAYLSSADGFRAAALKEFDDLEKRIRADIPSGAAVMRVLDFQAVRSDFPPKEVLPPLPKELSKETRAEVLREALREIERRRRLVNEHYRAMFEAARSAFPLAECLRPKK